jgi:hypothetical protein
MDRDLWLFSLERTRARSAEAEKSQTGELEVGRRLGQANLSLESSELRLLAIGRDGRPTDAKRRQSPRIFLPGYVSRGVLTVAFGSFSTKEIQAATIRPITVASRGVL